MENASQLLTDAEKYAFFFVTLPEALPIAVIKRFHNWFVEFGIPVGGVIVNGLIKEGSAGQEEVDFIRNRMAMQAEYMEEIDRSFHGTVRGVVPLFESDVRGIEMLGKVSAALFGD